MTRGKVFEEMALIHQQGAGRRPQKNRELGCRSSKIYFRRHFVFRGILELRSARQACPRKIQPCSDGREDTKALADDIVIQGKSEEFDKGP